MSVLPPGSEHWMAESKGIELSFAKCHFQEEVP